MMFVKVQPVASCVADGINLHKKEASSQEPGEANQLGCNAGR